MSTFTNENAKKALRVYKKLFLISLLFLCGIAIAIYIGMRNVNLIIRTYPELASWRFELFTRYQTYETTAILFFIMGALLFLGLGIVRVCQFNLYFHKNGKHMMQILDQEMNHNRAIWLPKSKTYLTDNYIISLWGAFTAVRYTDVLWVYQHVEKYYGSKTRIALKALMPDGKQHEIAKYGPVLTSFLKSFALAEDELTLILGFIAEKNQSVLIGYSDDNRAASKDIIKRIKNKG